MSLFLVYTEFGKPSPLESAHDQFKIMPITLINSSRPGSVRKAFAITDGLASDCFLQFGKHVAGRKGEILRASLLEFFNERLRKGVTPCFSFLIVHGELDELSLSLDTRVQIQIDKIPDLLQSIKLSEVYEVAP